ncbi:MAG: hypothetical protein AAB573_03130 [Patescibacteria group bacterium]
MAFERKNVRRATLLALGAATLLSGSEAGVGPRYSDARFQNDFNRGAAQVDVQSWPREVTDCWKRDLKADCHTRDKNQTANAQQ